MGARFATLSAPQQHTDSAWVEALALGLLREKAFEVALEGAVVL
jgi:hypothetical protein